MTKNKLLIGIIATLFGAMGIWFGMHQSPPAQNAAAPETMKNSETPEKSDPAAKNDMAKTLFSKQLMDKSGQMQDLSQWKGKPLIINFWASWCVPCVKEMPELAALQKELSPQGIALIGIGIDSPDNIREFATEHKIDYPLLIGGMDGTELSRQLGNNTGGLPFTLLIGADGKVKKSYLGLLDFKLLRSDVAQIFK